MARKIHLISHLHIKGKDHLLKVILKSATIFSSTYLMIIIQKRKKIQISIKFLYNF